MLTYYLLQIFAWIIGIGGVIFLFYKLGYAKLFAKKIEKASKNFWIGLAVIIFAVILHFFASHPYPIHLAYPAHVQSMAPGQLPPSIPFYSMAEFLTKMGNFEIVEDIGKDPNEVPPPINRTHNETVKLDLIAKEVIAEITDGIYLNYWTFNNRVPGPLLRVKEGDTIELSLTNDSSSLHKHNIDLHAVTGPGGGATVTKAAPGETKTFRWKALQPGLYVYHCAIPNVSAHMTHGLFGMILVEPKEGLPPVDHEFYIMQSEFYTMGGIGNKGLNMFDSQAMLDENPTYIVFNGKIESEPRMKVKAGDKVRIFVGNGGVSHISSFHAIGEIFETVYPDGAIGSPLLKNVQTTAVLPGGAAIVEFTVDVPGNYILVDHALTRLNKGAWAIIEAEGEPRPDIFEETRINF